VLSNSKGCHSGPAALAGSRTGSRSPRAGQLYKEFSSYESFISRNTG
jgi:hypothetical protein